MSTRDCDTFFALDGDFFFVPPNRLCTAKRTAKFFVGGTTGMPVVTGLKGICTACTAKYKKKVSTTKITLMYCNMKNATINSFENLAVHAVQFSFLDVGSSHFSFDLFGIEYL